MMGDERPRHLSIIYEMLDEYVRASEKFPPFNSAHEGYAVILEELEEAWDEIKGNNPERAIEEIIQAGAMCIRFVYDLGKT